MKNLALLALAAVALVGCGNSSSGDNASAGTTGTATTSSGGTTEGKKFRIGMCQSNNGEPYRVQMNADLMAAAKEHPEIDLVIKDASNESLKQRDQLEEFVQDKVDLILISPKEAVPLTAPVEKAMAAGIPVIVIDRPITSDNYTCFIGADNKKIGVALGKWLKAKLKPGAQIVELKGLMTTPVAQDRHNGFLEGMKGSDAKVVFDVDMKFLEPQATKEMESALSRFPHIDAVYAHNDPGAHGAYLAAKKAGREKEMIFVGIDALPNEGVKYVEQGIEAASFQYPTGGKEAIETALKILKKEPFEKKITLESKFFTTENVKSGGELVK
jgi:ribose transport system substrate-binding protein